MTANYVLLEKITVGAAGAASVTFSGIPQTGYTDLKVVYSARTTEVTTAAIGYIEFNNISSNFTNRGLQGDGTNAVSFSIARFAAYATGTLNTANTFSNGEIYIPNYNIAEAHSFSADVVVENNATTGYNDLLANLWNPSTAQAITSISLATTASNWAANSTFYLYGVAKLGTTPAIAPYATGGDTIMTDGTYWYHTFISSGTFTPRKSISCDYLVVAGGGGGGARRGAGAGAGGLRSTVTATGGGGSLETALSLETSAYTITIGAGGAGGVAAFGPSVRGTSGNNSVFSTITSSGGGGAGGSSSEQGSNGGSGGGSVDGETVGTGTINQGFAGGVGSGSAPNYGAGGGGGANVIGTSGLSNRGGNGGNGVATSITGSSVTYAGGGGGGTYQGGFTGNGGSGGGGGGTSDDAAGGAGTANTGGGGGGGGFDSSGAAGGKGGSGIVIIRYAV